MWQAVQSWVLFPLVTVTIWFSLAALACELLRFKVPLKLYLPLGFIITLFTTQGLVKAGVVGAPLLVVVSGLSLAGLVVAVLKLRDRKIDWFAVAAFISVYAVVVLTVVLSGSPTFTGYSVLGDTAVHFVGAERLVESGHAVADSGTSSYAVVFEEYFNINSYPSGPHTVLGVSAKLVDSNVAWVYVPFMALLLALVAVSFYTLVTTAYKTASKWWALLAAAIAAQANITYSFAVQGNIKEISLVATLALVLATAGLKQLGLWRKYLLLFAFTFAATTTTGAGALAWMLPAVVAAVVIDLFKGGKLKAVTDLPRSLLAGGAGTILVLAAVSFWYIDGYIERYAFLSNQSELGNLFLGPLNGLQVFGIWIIGDYRLELGESSGLTYFLVALVVVMIVITLVQAVRIRKLPALAVLFTGAVGLLSVTYVGSPWVDAKALAVTAPLAMLLALLAASSFDSGARVRRPIQFLVVVVAAAVVASNFLTYRQVHLAPKQRFDELVELNQRYGEDNLTALFLEFDEFAKFFIRDLTPNIVRDRGAAPPAFINGKPPAMQASINVDNLPPEFIDQYQLVIARRAPDGIRPPSGYLPVYEGKYYTAWRKDSSSPSRLGYVSHKSKGQEFNQLNCKTKRDYAELAASEGAKLRYVVKPLSVGVKVESPSAVEQALRSGGKFKASAYTSVKGSYSLWLIGNPVRETVIKVDGKRVGDVSRSLSQSSGQMIYMGEVQLQGGPVSIEVDVAGPGVLPDTAKDIGSFGALVLTENSSSRDPSKAEVQELEPKNYKQLCTKRLAWLEVVK